MVGLLIAGFALLSAADVVSGITIPGSVHAGAPVSPDGLAVGHHRIAADGVAVGHN
jgi:hypothetical protein